MQKRKIKLICPKCNKVVQPLEKLWHRICPICRKIIEDRDPYVKE